MSNTDLWNKIYAANSVNIDDGSAFAQSQTAVERRLQLDAQAQAIGGQFNHFWDPNAGGGAGGTLGGGLTPQQIQQIFTTIIANITPEEKAELELLKKEYENSVKAAKLGEFKKLHPELRQFIINLIFWKEAKERIESVQPDKPDRLKELENKESNGALLTGISQWQHSSTWYPHSNPPNSFGLDILALLPIPAGITAEELKEAHMEASLEEEMLNEEA